MIEQLSQMQTRIHTMREALLKEGSMMPRKKHGGPSLDAKKMKLRHLTRVAAAVAGAHWHTSNVEYVDIFSAEDKEGVRKHIIKQLRQNLEWLPEETARFWICLQYKKYEEDELPREEVAERRQAISEILDQLELLDREVDDMLGELDAYVA